jgi:S-adenosylmethionine:tRNA ribosyltransferase-isomerase
MVALPFAMKHCIFALSQYLSGGAMRVDAFDFDLPEECIALRPSEPREAARLLVITPGIESNITPTAREIEDLRIAALPSLLRSGDVLVFNNTRVLPAQLEGQRTGQTGTVARIGVTLHKRLAEFDWQAFSRPAKRLKTGNLIAFGDGFTATVVAKTEGDVTLHFDCDGRRFEEVLSLYGQMPLPPYIATRRTADARDEQDYQTIYAAHPGAVAAPTAGLHFTPALMGALSDAGIGTEFLTLHVGAGTFLPVKVVDTTDHRMHAEWGEISAEAADRLNTVRRNGGRIVAVGTTSLRLIESAADDNGTIHPFSGDTAIFITPGYRFKAVDHLFTNFHLPRSTLFMLVSAFSGLDSMKRAYAHAIASGYRFYSYGDACFLKRPI